MTSQIGISDKTEKKIVKWFKENCNTIKFIDKSGEYPTQATYLKETTKDLIEKLDEMEVLHTPKNVKIIVDLWKNLLGDAIIFLKSEDTREKYHDGEIFGIDNLYNILKEFRKFERMLYGATEYYRDHITHVFRVFLLGEYLIKEKFGFNEVDVVVDKDLKIEVSDDEKEAMWCVMSLTHDIGYALENIDKINDKVSQMIKQYGKASVQELTYLFPPQRKAIDDFVLKFISSSLVAKKIDDTKEKYFTHIQSKYFLKFSSAYEKFDHGIISCTVLMRALVYFLESDFSIDKYKLLDKDDAKQFLIRQTILRSIASHNCEDIYHLRGRNFPFLLMICDELQEWGRPRMEEVFKERIPETRVIIKKFDKVDSGSKKINLDVDYEIIFSCSKKISKYEKDRMLADVWSYFIRKTEKYIKILRSARGGEYRSINFAFSVTDNVGGKNYAFKLEQPDKGKEKLKPELFMDNTKKLSFKEIIDDFEKYRTEHEIKN